MLRSVERLSVLHLLTRRTEQIRVRIPSGPENSGPKVQKLVVGVVFADDEVSVAVVRFVSVDVVNFSAERQHSTNGRFDNDDVSGHTS
jgi:hypothetical protein